ncbi:MAG: PEP-CTERM sorting domain-containing protein [Verrucomicrobiales bacterium]|nr:PEP-CTERM sorting domain-containing protein [Verrucomicrobiales bacterium]
MNKHSVIKRAALLGVFAGMAALTVSARAETIYIGDAAAQGQNLTISGTNPGSHSLSSITYVFFGNTTENNTAYATPAFNNATYSATYQNTTGAPLELLLTEVNFYTASASGTVIPFVAIYSGADFSQGKIKIGANYNVVSIGDGITVDTANKVYPEAFIVSGGNPKITLNDGQILVAGCYVSGTSVLRMNGDANPNPTPNAGSDNTADYIYGGNGTGGYVLPDLGVGALKSNANYDKFRQNVMFNIGFEVIPEPATVGLLVFGGVAIAGMRLFRKRN